MFALHSKDMWDAVLQCNREYDGTFVYAVKTTRICCKPSCKSRAPLRENIAFYSSVSEAIADGYRPCKRCRPDVISSPEQQLMGELRQLIENESDRSFTLDELSAQIGMSKYHLQRLFKRNIGMSPQEYGTKIKMEKAQAHLSATENSITEIAFELGYTSSAQFSKVFRRVIGKSPSEYRRKR